MKTFARSVFASLSLLVPGPIWSSQPKPPATPVARKEFTRPELYIASTSIPLEEVRSELSNGAAWTAFLLQWRLPGRSHMRWTGSGAAQRMPMKAERR